ncbi:MAG: 2-dehydropantoate 2-reductase [Methanomassiliicoccales archaeon]
MAILGAGATGKALACFLQRGHNEVCLIAKKSQLQQLAKGITVSGFIKGSFKPQVCDAKHSSLFLRKAEFLIVAVKAYDTIAAIESIKGSLRDETSVVSLQNGFDSFHNLRRAGLRNIVSGITTLAVTPLSASRIRIVTGGKTLLGSVDGIAAEGVSKFNSILNSSGLKSYVSSNIMKEIWLKGIANSCINPLTALLHVTNGVLVEQPALRELVSVLCGEAVSIAHAEDLSLKKPQCVRRVLSICRSTYGNRSSMLVDIERGKRTEIESLNGYLCRIAERHSISADGLRSLLLLVRASERRSLEAAGL